MEKHREYDVYRKQSMDKVNKELFNALDSMENIIELFESGKISFEDIKELEVDQRADIVNIILHARGWDLSEVFEATILGNGEKYLRLLEIFFLDVLLEFYRYFGKAIEVVLKSNLEVLNDSNKEIKVEHIYEKFLSKLGVTHVKVPSWVKTLDKVFSNLYIYGIEDSISFREQLREIWKGIKNPITGLQDLKNFVEKYQLPQKIYFWNVISFMDRLDEKENKRLVQFLLKDVNYVILHGYEKKTDGIFYFKIGTGFGNISTGHLISVNEKFLIISHLNLILYKLTGGRDLDKYLDNGLIKEYLDLLSYVVKDIDKLDPLFSFEGVFKVIRTNINFFSKGYVQRVIEDFYRRIEIAGIYVIDYKEWELFLDLLEFLAQKQWFGKFSGFLSEEIIANYNEILNNKKSLIDNAVPEDVKVIYNKISSLLDRLIKLFDDK